MTNEQRQQRWIYVRSSAAFKGRIWFGAILCVGGGVYLLAHLNPAAPFSIEVVVGLVLLYLGLSFSKKLFLPQLKFNQDQLVLEALLFWSITCNWSDLTEIKLDEELKRDWLIFGPKRPVELFKSITHSFLVWRKQRKYRLYNEEDVLELTAFAQRKLEKENARTS